MRGTTQTGCVCRILQDYFNPRPPCGGRLANDIGQHLTAEIFQSTSPMRGTTSSIIASYTFKIISIHVPHAGDDVIRHTLEPTPSKYFNPRPPCGGRLEVDSGYIGQFDFNPRPPCGGRLIKSWGDVLYSQFQSTSPMRGTTAKMQYERSYVTNEHMHF